MDDLRTAYVNIHDHEVDLLTKVLPFVEKRREFVRKVLGPKLPTQAEVDEHYVMGHTIFRNWCPVCVRAYGKEMDHRRDTGKERMLPEYSWDYCFPGDELGYRWTVLVGRERGTKCWMATVVPTKGGGSKF